MYESKKLTQKQRSHKKFLQLRINQKFKKNLTKNITQSSCFYCKNIFLIKDLTIEHIVPLFQGGQNIIENITLACKPCNQNKGKQDWMDQRKLRKLSTNRFPIG